MKKPKDGVFRLIKGMTPAEKRYFKVHFGTRKSVLTDLFDYLNAQDSYDEDRLKEVFSEGVSRNYKVYKSQLWKLLLKSLTAFHSKRQVIGKIRTGLEEIDLLTDKGLYDLALEQLEKVKRLCQKYEQFTYLIEISRKEYALRHSSIDKIGLGKSPLYDTMFKSLEHLHNHILLSRLSNELIDIERQKESGFNHEELERNLKAILALPVLEKNPADSSFMERLTGNILRTKILDALGKRKEGGRWRKLNVELFSEYPHFKETLAFQYIGILRNYLNYCLVAGDYEEVKVMIKEALRFCDTKPEMRPQLIYFYYAEVKMLYDQCDFDPLLKDLLPKVMKHLKIFGIDKDRIAAMIYGFFILSYLATGDHRRAQKFVREFQMVNPDVRERYRALIFVLEWIIHYDAGDEFLAENLRQSYLRRMDEKELAQDVFLHDLVRFFRQLLTRLSQRAADSRALQAKLGQYPENGFIVDFFHYRLPHWLVATEHGLTIAEAVRRIETESLKKAPFP